MIIESSDNIEELKQYNNSNLVHYESLDFIEPNNINNNNIIQQ